jgi:16S rRNA processing protein RimM
MKHCNSPESAKIFTNLYIYVPRDDFPKLNNNEYYWADLENLKVINMENIELGIVTGLMSTGANDVLIVKNDNKETLIPYTKQVIVKVDLKQKTIKVNWDEIL